MAKVKRIGDESIDKMLRRFRKACNIEEIKLDYRKSLVYEKPSIKNKRRKKENTIETKRRLRIKGRVIL